MKEWQAKTPSEKGETANIWITPAADEKEPTMNALSLNYGDGHIDHMIPQWQEQVQTLQKHRRDFVGYMFKFNCQYVQKKPSDK